MTIQKFKEVIINNMKEYLDPEAWDEFAQSKNYNDIYTIKNDDLPIIRDVKSFLNMVTAIQTMAEKLTTKYALIGAAVGVGISTLDDLQVFYQNLKIYRSTNSIITHHLATLKRYVLNFMIPELIEQLRKLSLLFNAENFDKVSEFIIEQVITLEQYQETFKQKKLNPAQFEKKENTSDDLITKLAKESDKWLQYLYNDKYKNYFSREITLDENKNPTIDYYTIYPVKDEEAKDKPPSKIAEKDSKDADKSKIITPEDTVTTKNLKHLLNGIIALKKIYDYKKNQKSQPVMNAFSYPLNIIKSYTSFSNFEYEAIVAEQSKPFTDEIKKQLQRINEILEEVACYADELELELRLKEGILLNKLNMIIDQHNSIMNELRIPTDYVRQKNIFYKARMKSRQDKVVEIDKQIKALEEFMQVRVHAMVDIPRFMNRDIYNYLKKNYDEICMNRSNLDTYLKYLDEALNTKSGIKTFLKKQLEYMANNYGMTIHSEVMTALSNRLLYLKKQKAYILHKNQQVAKKHLENPFMSTQPSELIYLGKQSTVLKALIHHSEELKERNDSLLEKAVMKIVVKPSPEDKKATQTELVIDKEKTNIRIYNQISLKEKELGFFNTVIKNYEKDHTIPTPDELGDATYLSPKTTLLLQELNEILKVPERKTLIM